MGMVVVALLAANADRVSCGHDQINLKTNQVRCKLRQALMPLLGKPVLDGDILSLNPSKLAQLLPERLQEDGDTGSSASIQETYAEDFAGCCASADTQSAKSMAQSVSTVSFLVMFFCRSFHSVT